jgi:hypothetical protein
MQLGPGFVDPGDLVRQAHDVGSLVMLQITTVERRLAGASEGIAPASNAAITSRPSTGSPSTQLVQDEEDRNLR